MKLISIAREAVGADHMIGKLARYCGVSVVNVVLGQALLTLFHVLLEWPAALSNVLAVTISAIPAYLMSRAWVWRKDGDHSVRGEVVPFWGLAFAGLVLSTIAVSIADAVFEADIMLNVASLAAFGVVWVVKFVLLERVIFADAMDVVEPTADG